MLEEIYYLDCGQWNDERLLEEIYRLMNQEWDIMEAERMEMLNELFLEAKLRQLKVEERVLWQQIFHRNF